MTRKEAHAAFMAGFGASGEGFNNEWPFNTAHKDRIDAAGALLEEEFNKWWASHERDR